MCHVATLIVFFLAATHLADGSISSVKLKPGKSFLLRDAENATALARKVKAGNQKMTFQGPKKGKWVNDKGQVVDSSNFELFANGSVLLKSASLADAGTYQKDPNPMIRIGDIAYAPPILILQVVKK
uniref:Uncharacterized protein n=1 Tax=Caenorhabditis japonica TaxID=281687 RepID=A0A8R1DWE5_CAEJA